VPKLTDRQIRSTKPSDKDQFYSDGDGLYLRVTKNGHKTFYQKNQSNGGTRWVNLGSYPEVSLLEARLRNTQSKMSSGVVLVQTVYALFDKNILSKYKLPEVSRSRFRLDVLPALTKLPISSITRRHVSEVLQKIIDRGSPIAANRTLADMNHLFQFAWERGYIESNPCTGITRKSVGGRERPRDRNLSWDDIDAFLLVLHSEITAPRGMSVTTAAALYVCLLTGQRASEVLHIMSTGDGQLPDTKSSSPHRVHLSIPVRAAMTLLKGLPLPRDHRVLSHALRRVGVDFTPHDLRRTMASRLSDIGVFPHVIEKMLNHKMEGVMAVYNHGDYWVEQVEAWNLWGAEIKKRRPRRAA